MFYSKLWLEMPNIWEGTMCFNLNIPETTITDQCLPIYQNKEMKGRIKVAQIQASLTRKCHHHRPQTDPWYQEEDTQNINSHTTVRTQLK